MIKKNQFIGKNNHNYVLILNQIQNTRGKTYVSFLFLYFLKNILFIYFWREKERERNNNVWLPLTCPLSTWDLACNPGMRPDWESNQ